MRRKPEIQIAYDKGVGRRGLTLHRENPYHPEDEPDKYAAWAQGFDDEDRRVNAMVDRELAKLASKPGREGDTPEIGREE